MKEIQEPKPRIDTGIRGDASTGDALYDGGVKINTAIDELYDILGDWRLSQTPGQGEGLQKLHAMGYWQKYPIEYYIGGPIEVGTMHDIDTTDNPISIILPNGAQGEQVFFRNSTNSWGTNPISVTSQAGESIDGITDPVDFRQSNSIVEFTCTSDTVGDVNWTYKVIPLNGDFSVPVNSTTEVTDISSVTIPLFSTEIYNSVKVMLYASDLAGNNKTTAELLIMGDPGTNNVYTSEYAVLTKGDKPYTVDFESVSGQINAIVTTDQPRIVFTIKSIETIKVTT